MQLRSFAISAALLGTSLTSISFMGDALAQKGVMMRPSGAWAVTSVSEQADPYCALARKYNRDTVLTMARNRSEETSFAIDFQRGVFKSQDETKITLDPGAGQQRVYSVAPVSEQAFVVRLGKDSSFFGALERTGVLRVEVNDQSYHFNVADIEAGQGKLASCVMDMVVPASGDEDVVNNADTIHNEVMALKGKISNLEAKNTTLSSRVSQYDSAPHINMMDDPVLKKQAALLETLRLENNALKSKLETQDVSVDEGVDLAEVEALRAELSILKSKNAALLAQASNGHNDDLSARLKLQIKALEDEKRVLNKNAAQAKIAFNDQIRVLSVNNEALVSEAQSSDGSASLLKKLEDQVAALGAEKEEFETHIGRVESMLFDVEVQRDEAIAAQKNLERVNKDTKKTVQRSADMDGIIAELESKIDKLTDENKAKDLRLVTVEKKAMGHDILKVENEALNTEVAAIKAKAKGGTGPQGEIISTLLNENKTLKKQLVAFGRQAERQGRLISALEKDLNGVRSENVRLHSSEQSEGYLTSAQYQEVEAQRDAMKNSLRDVVALAESYRAKMSMQDVQLKRLVEKNFALQETQMQQQVAMQDVGQNNNGVLQDIEPAAGVDSLALELEALADDGALIIDEPDIVPRSLVDQFNVHAKAPLGLEDFSEHSAQQTEGRFSDVLKNVGMDKIEPGAGDGSGSESPIEIEGWFESDDPMHMPLTDVMQNYKPREEGGIRDAMMQDVSQPVSNQNGAQNSLPKSDTPDVQEQQDAPQENAQPLPRVKEASLEFDLEFDDKIEINLNPANDVLKIEPAAGDDKRANFDVAAAPLPNKKPSVPARYASQKRKSVMEIIGKASVKKAQIAAKNKNTALAHNVVLKDALEEKVAIKKKAFKEASLQALVNRADVDSHQEVQEVDVSSKDYESAYEWKGENVFGSAEQKKMSSPAAFDKYVDDYLDRTKERCPGEFAVVPDESLSHDGARTDSYEIACVNEGQNLRAGASLLFFNQGGTFTAVAHEASTDHLEVAMSYRNRLMKLVSGS